MDVRFPPLKEGLFLQRFNRFLASVAVEERECLAHVPNSGRLEELLVPGAKIWLAPAKGAGRKTLYDLSLVETEGRLVSLDSRLPNQLVSAVLKQGKLPFIYYQEVKPCHSWQSSTEEDSISATSTSAFARGSAQAVFSLSGPLQLKREVSYKDSRFDFLLEDRRGKIWLETKSVNLVFNKEARFPDAPTQRGTRHVRELTELKRNGDRAVILFVVLRDDALRFVPYTERDPDFTRALIEGRRAGVEIYAIGSRISLEGIGLMGEIPVEIQEL